MDSGILWTYKIWNDFFLSICLSVCLIIYAPKETWKTVFTLFHTWDRILYNTLSPYLHVVMAVLTHKLWKSLGNNMGASSSKSGSLKIYKRYTT